MYTRFLPAISRYALKKISGEVRSWLHRKVNYTFAGLATMTNPIVAGWMHYYGRFRRSAMYPLLARINAYLVRWIRKKYRRLQGATTPTASCGRSPRATPPVRAVAMDRLSLDVTRMTRAV